MLTDTRWTGSLLQSVTVPTSSILQLLSFAHRELDTCVFQISQQSNIDVIPPVKEYILNCCEIKNLQEMYKMLYPSLQVTHSHRIWQKLQNICVCGEILSSVKGNIRNSCVAAHWKSPSTPCELRIGHIQYFLKHRIDTVTGQVEHVIAVVHWFKKHPQEMYFGTSSYIVRSDVESGYSFCYVPVQRLASRCCFGTLTVDFPYGSENVIVAVPISFKFCI